MKQFVLVTPLGCEVEQMMALIREGYEVVSAGPRYRDGYFGPDGYIIVFKERRCCETEAVETEHQDHAAAVRMPSLRDAGQPGTWWDVLRGRTPHHHMPMSAKDAAPGKL